MDKNVETEEIEIEVEIDENLKFIQDIAKEGEKCTSHEDISVIKTIQKLLPDLIWMNYEIKPRQIKLINTGNSLIAYPKFDVNQPYLRGGPLLDETYFLSQIHFHWSSGSDYGSLHTIDGSRVPLEIHAIHIKSSCSEEDAYKNELSIAIVVQFYEISCDHSSRLQPLICNLPVIRFAESVEIFKPFPITNIVVPFPVDYYLYSNSSKIFNPNYFDTPEPSTILWLISRETGTISLEQFEYFKYLLNNDEKKIIKKFPECESNADRKLYHISPLHPITNSTLSPVTHRKEFSERNKLNLKRQSKLEE